MAHSEISSVAEPWVMLPLCYTYRENGIFSEFDHFSACEGVSDFISNLPGGFDDYFSQLRAFLSSLYEAQCQNNEAYFLDKTPRYYNIINDISNIFPDAKFIFLFRNPAHVFSSILNTWCDGKFRRVYTHYDDLMLGPKLLSEGYHKLKNNCCAIQYERFIESPEKIGREICDYLGLEFEYPMIDRFMAQRPAGRMGDPTGVNDYRSVSLDPLAKWKTTFRTRFRKKILLKYLDWMDSSDIVSQGYDVASIKQEVKDLPVKSGLDFGIEDRMDLIYAYLVLKFKLNLIFGARAKHDGELKFFS